MKVSAITLGCKVNQYETQAMLGRLAQAGFSACEDPRESDVILLNSCTVTASSDHKVRQALHRARRDNPGAVIVLTGCMPQAFPQEAAALEDADIVLGNSNRASLLPHLQQYLSSRRRIIDIVPHGGDGSFEPMHVDRFYDRTRAFIKIEDGCNRFCSYCIIPYARGRVRSRPLEELRREAEELAENGYREIVLTGINLSAYGQEEGLSLCDAVEAVCGITGVARVRLGSLEPERLDAETTARLAAEKKLCPQFHLSLQSGCNATLQRMNRHYTAEEYRAIVARFRSAFENAAITTDIMVGFPGETEEEFRASIAFAEEIRFARAHVFAYSRRPGTRANDMPDQILQRVKEERSRLMCAATSKTREAFYTAQISRSEPVLFERECAKNVYEGYTANYTPVRVPSPRDLCGKIQSVRITEFHSGGCTGVLQENL